MKFKQVTINLTIIAVGALTFSGCAHTYNLQPEYNKETKSVKISNLRLDNVSYYNKKKTKMNDRSMNNIKRYRESFKLEGNPECNKLSVKVQQAYNSWYFHDSMLEDVMKYYNNNCQIEKIANLNFGICKKTKTVTTNEGKETTKEVFNYGVTESKTNQYGYDSKISIDLKTKSCYTKIRDHFKQDYASKGK